MKQTKQEGVFKIETKAKDDGSSQESKVSTSTPGGTLSFSTAKKSDGSSIKFEGKTNSPMSSGVSLLLNYDNNNKLKGGSVGSFLQFSFSIPGGGKVTNTTQVGKNF